jgi:squalene-hopene/tetraprenyl-beta-curcumene cyclase
MLDEIADAAVNFLLAQAANGFSETRHWMRFPRSQGFSSQDEVHAGDVFQRAVIIDALLDAKAELGLDLDKLISAEIDYLLSCRRPAKLGAWSYFPDLPELPADADTLGQMIRILARTGRSSDLGTACKPALAILLSDGINEDGSIDTWILPRRPESHQRIQAHFVRTAWGTGADCEVMANLLDALLVWEPFRYNQISLNAVRYIEAQQQPAGSWLSTWYYGPFYGTYACSRLVRRLHLGSTTMQKAEVFLHQTQAEDGGWGVGPGSDPLSTGLALLGLANVEAGEPAENQIATVTRSLDFLASSMHGDRAWIGAPFIKMPVNRPGGLGGPEITFGSSTITAAYCLKATLAWRPRLVEVSKALALLSS